jgi:hypothetical protein
VSLRMDITLTPGDRAFWDEFRPTETFTKSQWWLFHFLSSSSTEAGRIIRILNSYDKISLSWEAEFHDATLSEASILAGCFTPIICNSNHRKPTGAERDRMYVQILLYMISVIERSINRKFRVGRSNTELLTVLRERYALDKSNTALRNYLAAVNDLILNTAWDLEPAANISTGFFAGRPEFRLLCVYNELSDAIISVSYVAVCLSMGDAATIMKKTRALCLLHEFPDIIDVVRRESVVPETANYAVLVSDIGPLIEAAHGIASKTNNCAETVDLCRTVLTRWLGV